MCGLQERVVNCLGQSRKKYAKEVIIEGVLLFEGGCEGIGVNQIEQRQKDRQVLSTMWGG